MGSTVSATPLGTFELSCLTSTPRGFGWGHVNLNRGGREVLQFVLESPRELASPGFEIIHGSRMRQANS